MNTHDTSPDHRFAGGERLGRVLAPVLLLTGIFLLHFMARQIAGPLLPAMETGLGVTHIQGGLFILCMGVGFFLGQIGATHLASRFGYRRCILLSLWAAAAATAAFGLADSVRLLYLVFLCLGTAGGLYVPSGITLITVLVRPRDWGKAMGIHELAPNLALIAVPFMATAAVAAGSWRIGYLFVAAVLASLAVAYTFFGVDSEHRPSAPDLLQVREIARHPSFWCLVLLLSLAVGVETGVYSMIPLFLVTERSFDLAAANHLLGLSRIPGLLMVLLAGWFTDRLSPSTTISLSLAATGAAIVVLGIGPASLVAPAVFVQSAAAACLFPPALSLASRISTSESRTLTLSLSLAVAPVIGGGLLPAGIALAGDLGSFAAGMAGAGIVTAAGIALVGPMKRYSAVRSGQPPTKP